MSSACFSILTSSRSRGTGSLQKRHCQKAAGSEMPDCAIGRVPRNGLSSPSSTAEDNSLSPRACGRVFRRSAVRGRSDSYMQTMGRNLSLCPELRTLERRAPAFSGPLFNAGYASRRDESVRQTLDMNLSLFCIQGTWQTDRTSLIRGRISPARAANGRIRQRRCSTAAEWFSRWVCMASGEA